MRECRIAYSCSASPGELHLLDSSQRLRNTSTHVPSTVESRLRKAALLRAAQFKQRKVIMPDEWSIIITLSRSIDVLARAPCLQGYGAEDAPSSSNRMPIWLCAPRCIQTTTPLCLARCTLEYSLGRRSRERVWEAGRHSRSKRRAGWWTTKSRWLSEKRRSPFVFSEY